MVKSVSRLIAGCLGMALCVPSSAALFPRHGSVKLENQYANAAGIERYRDAAEMQDDIDSGVLVPVPIAVNPRLPAFRRYVRQSAAAFMLELNSRFESNIGHSLICDSAVRPVEVQRVLRKRNRSAAPATGETASSHERGTTFDLAKKMVRDSRYTRMRRGEYRWLMLQLAYYQAIGRIHVIEERSCIHIMVREDYVSQL